VPGTIRYLVPATFDEELLIAAVFAVGDDALVALVPANLRRAANFAAVLEPVVERRVVLQCRRLVVKLGRFAFGEVLLEQLLEIRPTVDEWQKGAVDVVSFDLDAVATYPNGAFLGLEAGQRLELLELGDLLGLGKIVPHNRGEHVCGM
jgi:hypothetical protein